MIFTKISAHRTINCVVNAYSVFSFCYFFVFLSYFSLSVLFTGFCLPSKISCDLASCHAIYSLVINDENFKRKIQQDKKKTLAKHRRGKKINKWLRDARLAWEKWVDFFFITLLHSTNGFWFYISFFFFCFSFEFWLESVDFFFFFFCTYSYTMSNSPSIVIMKQFK